MSADEGFFCAKCGASACVVWCPAWNEYLCPNHQHERTYRELDATDHPEDWLTVLFREVTVVTL